MTAAELARQMGLTVLVPGEMETRQVEGCYCGDLLSWVMGRAQSGDAWITVMGNINSIAVAVLADAACILLAENASLDEDARAKAESNGVTVLQSEKNAYQLAVELHQRCLS